MTCGSKLSPVLNTTNFPKPNSDTANSRPCEPPCVPSGTSIKAPRPKSKRSANQIWFYFVATQSDVLSEVKKLWISFVFPPCIHNINPALTRNFYMQNDFLFLIEFRVEFVVAKRSNWGLMKRKILVLKTSAWINCSVTAASIICY